ncbi:MAG: hypothetical protein M1831_006319 [Alyxoria varia]|nr:MAG: hypothetical protein M1831_006319 [Alyxoria varia]
MPPDAINASYGPFSAKSRTSNSFTRTSKEIGRRSSSDSSLDEFDPLHDAPYETTTDEDEDEDEDEDDDDGIAQETKAALRRSRRRSHSLRQSQKRKYKAFDVNRRTTLPKLPVWVIRKLPPWLLSRRFYYLLASVIVFSILLGVLTGGFWVYNRSRLDGESPPWYPSPRGGTLKRWKSSYTKAAKMVQEMSLAEKVNITTGTGWMMGMCVGNTGPATNVGFPSLCLQDGPLGIRFADNITASPAGITVGATWNKDLMHKRGKMLGLESRLKGVNVLLGPSVGPLGRIPAGGRNWEGFGIDPVLQGVAAATTVLGIQEEGVMATIKQFVANEQEHFRQAWEWGLPDALSSNLDDRTLHELYAWPFADAIRAGVASVMCSYNQVNNSYACQNSKLINGIIKDELGFQGFVQSDWLAQRSGVASALAGLDMSMPGDGAKWADGRPFWGPHLTMAALNGSLPMERLNDMVTRIVAAWYQTGQDDKKSWPPPPPEDGGGPNFSSWTDQEYGYLYPGTDDEATGLVNQYVDAANSGTFSHSALARRIAAEGIVLLKNQKDILPLTRNGTSENDDIKTQEKMRISIYGEDAVEAEGGPNVCVDRACNRGTLASGWGSGAVEFPYLISPVQALQRGFHGDGVELTFSPSNKLSKNATKPEQQDLCIVFVNSDGGEGFVASEGIKGDRNDLNLQKGGEKLIKDVSSGCGKDRKSARASQGKTIVIIHAVGPVMMESFIEDRNVAAVLLANLPGQESGNGLADVLFGRVNPSGHLPYTIAKSPKDYGPSEDIIFYPNGVVPQQNFTEGLLVDYRWFDAMRLSPRFEFGFGLTYTTFELQNLKVTSIPPKDHHPSTMPAARPENEIEPPSFDDPAPDSTSAEFPKTLKRLKKYIYPYIESARDVHPDPSPPHLSFPTEEPSQAGGAEGGNPALWEELVEVEVEVINEGERSGQAVVQLYVVFPQDVWESFKGPIPSADERNVAPPPPADQKPEDPPPSAPPSAEQTTPEDAQKAEEQGSSPSPPKAKLTKRQGKSRSERIVFPPRVLRAFEKVHLRGSVSISSPGATIPHPHEPLENYHDEPPSHVNVHTDMHYSKDDDNAQEKPGNHWKDRLHHQFTQPPTKYATGEKKKVKFNLTRRDLSYWSAARQNWVLPKGAFGIEVGFSCRDLRLRGRAL